MGYSLQTVSKLMVVIVFFFCACSSQPENTHRLQLLEESIITNYKNTKRNSEVVYAALQEKLIDPATAYRAQVWQPKAAQIQTFASEVENYLAQLKKQLRQAATADVKAKDAVGKNLFVTKGTDRKLYQMLISFKAKSLAIDTLIKNEFAGTFYDSAFEKTSENENVFRQNYFLNTDYATVQAMLSQLLATITAAENKLLNFCLEQCPDNSDYFEVYSAIIGQNSSYVRKGEKMEITAGVGIFSFKAQPRVIINGDTVAMTENGTAQYHFKALAKAGKHMIPVRIDCFDQYGKKQMITKNVEYTVANN